MPPEVGDSDDETAWSYPHHIESLPPVQTVALGANHACALGRDGRVLCWGDARQHQLGTEGHAPRETAGPVPGLGPAEDLVATDEQTCARTTDGAVRCWGGRVGDLNTSRGLDAPRRVDGLPTLTRLLTGPIPCGLDPEGVLVCWHNNGRIDLGPRTADPIVRFPMIARARQVSLGVESYNAFLSRGCGLLGNGTVRCFSPRQGACDDGTCDAPVEGLADVVSLAAGIGHHCVARRDGSVWCWGRNTGGALGDGSVVDRAQPVQVPGLADVVEVAVTGDASCALQRDGAVRCWGSGAHGTLGNGSLRPQLLPRRVRYDGTPEGPEAAALESPEDPCVTPRGPSPRQPSLVSLATAENHSCVALGDGRVRCWGAAYSGAIGNERIGATAPAWSPVEAGPLRDAVQVAVAGHNSCALRRDRTVWCWGSDGERQILGANRSQYDAPQRWPGDGYAEVSVSRHMVCARRGNGTVVCSGGFAHPGARFEVSLPARALQLRGGIARTCALLGNGRVACWSAQMPRPVLSEAFPARPVEIAVSSHHGCARLVDGTVACWGDGNHGQLGLGAVGDAVQPRRVPGLEGVVAVAVADDRSCATRDDGSVWCWGSNRVEQGASGAGESFQTPTRLVPLAPVRSLQLGVDHTCAVLVGGPMCCWGSDSVGQLGRGPRDAEGESPRVRHDPVTGERVETPASRPAPLLW